MIEKSTSYLIEYVTHVIVPLSRSKLNTIFTYYNIRCDIDQWMSAGAEFCTNAPEIRENELAPSHTEQSHARFANNWN